MPEVKSQTSVTSESNIQKDEASIETGTLSNVRAFDVRVTSQAGMLVLSEKLKHLNSAVVNPEKLTLVICGKSNEPLTRADLIGDTDEKVKEIIFKIKTLIDIPLGARLLVLFNETKEEDPSSSEISYGSLMNFYNFLTSLKTHGKVKRPFLSLTPDNNIYASWRLEEGRIFSIHFLPEEDVRFVVFKPNERHPDRKIRVSGTTTTDTIIETVAPYGVWDWISE